MTARILAVAVGGALAGACFLPVGWGWLFPLFLVPLYWSADEAPSPSRAFLLGWLFGTAAWAAGIHWFPPTAARFMLLPPAAAFLVYAGFCACHGLMGGAWGAGVHWLSGRIAPRLGRPAALALAGAPAGVLLDGYFPQQFPIPFAAALYGRLSSLQTLELFGPAGVAALLFAGGGGLYAALRYRRWGLLAAVAAAALANDLWGGARMARVSGEAARRLAAGEAVSVGIVQAAVPYDAKGAKERFAGNLQAHRSLMRLAMERSDPPELALWPETSYERVVAYRRLEGRAVGPIIDGAPFARTLRRDIPYRVPIVLSAIGEGYSPGRARRRYNTAVLAGADGRFLDLVEKTRLLPFGEYIPFGERLPGLYALSPRSWRLSSAESPRLLEGGPARMGVLICYEGLLADFSRRYAGMGAELLVNLSNDAWFVGAGPEQHLRLTALRAIETRRYVLRAVNSGVSAVIGPAGRTLRRLDFGERGVIVERVAKMDGKTLYTRTGPLWHRLAALALVFLVLWARFYVVRSPDPILAAPPPQASDERGA